MEKKIRIGIGIDTMLELLKTMWLVTEQDGIEVTIYNPEVLEMMEEKDLEKIVKIRKMLKELSKVIS